MAFDLDDDELRATRRLNGVDKKNSQIMARKKMSIEESKRLLGWVSLNKLYIDTHNECDYHNIHTAIETLLTAYEEKCKELKKEIQDDLDVRNRWGLTLQELEKEKEKNKKARYYIYDALNNDDIINVGIDDMKIILDMLEE